MNDRQVAVVDVQIILRKADQVLLLLRHNTGYEDGKFHLPAGHVMCNEDALSAAIREAKEEINIDVAPKDIHFAGVVHRLACTPRISFFFHTEMWEGDIINREPEKCSELVWCSIYKLPNNTVPFIQKALERPYLNPFFISFFDDRRHDL